MGGEGPGVRFSQDVSVAAYWANRTGLKCLDKEELEAAYAKAKDFLLQKEKILVDDHDWHRVEHDINIDTLVYLTSKKTREFFHHQTIDLWLQLPSSFTSFLDPAKTETWSIMFRRSDIFNASRPSHDLFIKSAPPLSDIFYLLQTFLPGMLLIYRIDDIDDWGEWEMVRALPRPVWIEEHKYLLQTTFGETRYDSLLEAAASKGQEETMISDYRSYYDDNDNDHYTNRYGQREVKDFAACDSECGYCGTCDY